MNLKKYIHNSQHVPMGCGSQANCVLCGPEDAFQEAQKDKIDLKKIILVATMTSIIGGVVSELIVKRLIFKKKG